MNEIKPQDTNAAERALHLLGRPAVSFTLAAGTAWLVVVLAGMFLLLRYSQAAGLAGNPPAQWPVASLVPQSTGMHSLILFLHPHCPCSRASIGELEQIMTHCQGQVSAQVLFVQPAEMSEAWAHTGLWHTAAAIPGVSVRCDHAGVEARRFQALTSGQTLLYDPAGALLFQGGITLSRSHAGDNPGRSAVESLVRHESSDPAQTWVFGCALGVAEIQKGCVACKP
ncbi:hypothetical protein [Prosthecobacter sp.]|uniref:hypothetical protein n=1 Tax=Prosthecobacter sp. TaxID=1965333 RepID=UPI002ABC642C|nr:hypothetical protein [Prosthecobacter sp.]MDZ4405416.1 hypothetical protein [Prosthecobacter sp.]